MINQLPADRLKIHLDTRRPIQAETSSSLIRTAAQALREVTAIGDDASIEIVELHQGSWWLHLLIIAGGVGAVLQGARSLADEIREGKTPFAKSIAEAVAEGEAQVCEIITSEEVIQMSSSEMRALSGMVPGKNRFGVGPFGAKDFGSGAKLNRQQQDGWVFESTGHVIEGVSPATFMDSQGLKFEILHGIKPFEIPVEKPITIQAAELDNEPLNADASGTIELFRWRHSQRDDPWVQVPKSARPYSGGVGPHDKERLASVFGKLSGNEFLAVGHIRKGAGVAYFDASDGRAYRIENVDAVRSISTGEVAAVLEERGVSEGEGTPRVWLVKYQTASWNIDD